MKTFAARLIIPAVVAAASARVHAESGLHDALKDSVGAHWVYDDFPRAKAEAQRTGQPLLVVFRCVP